MNFAKYGSINNIKKNAEILLYEVCVTEKIHGTNARFTIVDGNLFIGSRNNTIYREPNPPKDLSGHYGMSEWLVNHQCMDIIRNTPELNGHIFYGEFHGAGVQKGVKYSSGKDFRLFDIRNPEGEFLDWSEVERIAKLVGLQTVPVLFKGKLNSVDQLNQFININSTVAIENGIELENNISEGIVVRTLKTLRDNRGNRLIVKYKSEKWCEDNDAKTTKLLTPEEVEQQAAAREFAERVVTTGRTHTIVDHITRDSDEELDIRRMGDFLKEMNQDIAEEFSDLFNSLEKQDRKLYNKTISQYAAKAFKDYLMET